VNTVGGEVVGVGKWWWLMSEGGRPVVRTGRLTLGAHEVSLLSPNYLNRLNIKKSKWVSKLTPKIPNFYMWVACDIMNIFTKCAGIQVQTHVELKILEQIQHLNFY
jgi:hypothetical protein